MKNNGSKKRSETDAKFKWDIEAMYPDESLLKTDINKSLEESSEFTKSKGHIMDSSSSLLNALDAHTDIFRTIEKAFVYAHMKHDEDNSDPKYTEMNDMCMSALAKVSAALSFFTPELLASPAELVQRYVEAEPGLRTYEHLLDSVMQRKAHILTGAEEHILATLSEALSAPDEIFTMLNDADMDFGEVVDENGDTVKLTHGNFITLMESADRNVRRNVYEQLYGEYKKLNNTISVMYNYNVKTDAIGSRLRKYDSTLESALSSEKIPSAVYTNLIDAVHKNLPSMYKYVGIRKRVLGLDELHMYDIYRPLVKPEGLECDYAKAVDIACNALAPLGDEYVAQFRKGVTKERWVDIYENKGKTSGAYSFGSYDSYPYILMNFNDDIKDVFTLVHEGGHSMHSWYTRKSQPYIYGSHSIFTAEVASTVNETLLIHYLLENAETDEMRAYLINFYIDEFKSTLFRQTMFAEFEKIAHDTVESGGSLTAEFLNSEYDKLNDMYFGPDLSHDDYIKYEWSRIPHFYRSFYVYQYATGYSAANAIANRLLNEGPKAREDYLAFLGTGDSDYPIELLKIAGVDMSTEAPVLSALSTFGELVDRLDKIL